MIGPTSLLQHSMNNGAYLIKVKLKDDVNPFRENIEIFNLILDFKEEEKEEKKVVVEFEDAFVEETEE